MTPITDKNILKALLPCPFCNQPASLVGWGEGSGYRVHVECNSCRNSTSRCSYDSQAIAAWNRRAFVDTVLEELAVEVEGCQVGYGNSEIDSVYQDISEMIRARKGKQ